MDDLSEKMTILRLQDEKTSLMKKELELEENILLINENIESIVEEKTKLDSSNTEIEENIASFNKRYDAFQKTQNEIVYKAGHSKQHFPKGVTCII